MPVLKKQSLPDQLYEELRTNIINLTYPLGSKVNVNELQSVYGVSSTPIREAINRLQIEGLVVYENNVGARVLSLKAEDVYEIQDLAVILHSAAIRFAMERADHKVLAQEIQKYLKDYYHASTNDEDVKCIFNIIGAFYRHCGNSRLDNNMKVIQGEQLILRYLYRQNQPADKSKDNYLEQMYAAVIAGDAEKIIRILKADYAKTTKVLVEVVAHLQEE